MALTRAGQHPVNQIFTSIVAEGVDQPFLIDQGVLPQLIVPEISGTFLSDDPRAYTGDQNNSLARASGAPRATGTLFDPISGTFNITDFGYEVPIDLRIDTITDQLSQLPVRRAIQAANIIKNKAEARLAALLFDAGAFWNGVASSANLLSATQWDVAAGSPMTDLSNLCHNTFPLQSFGERPNTIVLGMDVANVLNIHAETRGYLPGNILAGTTTIGVGGQPLDAADNFAMLRNVIAKVTGIPANRVFIGSYVQNTANLGQAGVPAFMWSDNVWVGKVDLGASRSVNSANRVSLAPTAAIDFSAHAFEAGSWLSQDKLTQWQYAQQANGYTAVNATLGFLVQDALV